MNRNWYKKLEESVNKINEKSYPIPSKQYELKNNKASWTKEADDYNWWSSEDDDFYHNYAQSYKATITPEDFLNLTTREGVANLKKGMKVGGVTLRDLDIDEFNKEVYNPLQLNVEFSDDFKTAKVVNHEGRHRAFALMQQGIKEIEIVLYAKELGAFDKYHPRKIKSVELIGQFNPGARGKAYNLIPMSYNEHKKFNIDIDENIKNNCLETHKEHYNKLTSNNQLSLLGDLKTTNNANLDEEYLDDDKDIYTTTSAYDASNRIKSSKIALRILWDRNLDRYFICDADWFIHRDMANIAVEKGYYNMRMWQLDEYLDDYGKNVIYYIYAPKGKENETYGSNVSEDGYEGKYVYDFGTMTTRSDDKYKSSPLAKALGKYNEHYIQDGWIDDYTPKIVRVESLNNKTNKYVRKRV